jgi:hypothetical protein
LQASNGRLSDDEVARAMGATCSGKHEIFDL